MVGDWTAVEWAVGAFVVIMAGLFWAGVLGLLRVPLRWAVRRIGRWLGLMLVVAMVAALPGQADAATEVRRLCGERAAGNRVVQFLAESLRMDPARLGQWQSWRLWSLELCGTFEFNPDADADPTDFQSLAPATIEFRTAPGAALYWDAEDCETWQYRQRDRNLMTVVGKCHVSLNLLPLGARFNVRIWARDIYSTFLVGQGGYRDFPLPFWIDPNGERALEYLPGPEEENAALERARDADLERIMSER